MAYLIRNAHVFDGSGAALFLADIEISGNRIASILPPGSALLKEGDTELDAQGKTLMPGMVEGHAHLSWGSSVEKIYHEFSLPEDELRVATWRNARILLDHGFTSAYSAGALGESLEVDLAAEIASGKTPGPRLIPSTIERSPEGEDNGNIFHGRGPESMRAFMRHCGEMGIKSVKLMISGEDALLPGSSQHILYTEEELAAGQQEAERAGLWIAAHAYTTQAIKLALKYGARVIYHCSWADQEAIELIAAARDRIFYAPAAGVIVGTLEAKPPPHIDMKAMKESSAEILALDRKLVPQLHKHGVRVLIGGDYGFPFNLNGRNARDLEHFVNLFGYTPSEALVAATKFGGEIMNLGHELGLIKAGYLADLLLVDGDPTKDIRILQDKNRLHLIMKDGVVYKDSISAKLLV